jgi:hypothetical protein
MRVNFIIEDAWTEGYESIVKAENADAISSKKDNLSFRFIEI